MRVDIERRSFDMGALNPPSLEMVVHPFRFVMTGTSVRYLIAVFASLLVHWAAFALLTANILIDGARDRGDGADLIVYLGYSAKPVLLVDSPDEGKRANSRAPSSSVADSSHDSGLSISSSYFSIKELDVAPEIVREIDASSEELKKRPSDGGKVILRLWIDEAGHMVRVEPLSSEMPSIYSETAVRAFMRAEFHPGIKNGNFVRSKINIVLFYPAVLLETGNVPAAPVFP